jgi:hypothetical protein
MEYLLKSSIVLGIFYICYRLFLQKETFFEANRWFLLVGIFAATFLPFVIIPIHIVKEAPIIPHEFNVVNTTEIATISLDYLTILFYLYVIGVIGFTIHLLIQFTSLGKLFYTHHATTNETYKIVKTDASIAPFSFFKWIVFNPNQFNTEELHQILTHEKVHARQWHSIDIIITQIATIIFWFNPLIWLYKKALQQNLEFIADSETQKDINCKKSYQYLLLKTVTQNNQMALANNFYNSLIKKRIVMLHKNKSQKRNAWKYALVLPLMALFLMSFNTKKIITYKDNISSVITEETHGNIEMVLITKNTSDAELKSITETHKAKGIHLKFKGIKRNKANEITKIDISAKTENSKVSYNTNGDEGIDPIKITIDLEHNKVSISDSKQNNIHFSDEGTVSYIYEDSHDDHKKHKEHKKIKKHKIHKEHKKVKRKDGNVFVYSSSSSDSHGGHTVIEEEDDKIIIKKGSKIREIKMHDKHKDGNVIIIKEDKDGNVVTEEIIEHDGNHTWVSDDGKTVEVVKSGKNNNMFFVSSGEDGSDPLYILNGKEISKDEMIQLDPNTIESVSVLKEDAAKKAYGKKGKNGVIVIKTKN